MKVLYTLISRIVSKFLGFAGIASNFVIVQALNKNFEFRQRQEMWQILLHFYVNEYDFISVRLIRFSYS